MRIRILKRIKMMSRSKWNMRIRSSIYSTRLIDSRNILNRIIPFIRTIILVLCRIMWVLSKKSMFLESKSKIFRKEKEDSLQLGNQQSITGMSHLELELLLLEVIASLDKMIMKIFLIKIRFSKKRKGC